MKIWRAFMWLFILVGFFVLPFLGYLVAADTYALWRHGVEKSALVIALDHLGSSGRSGSKTYYYEIEMDGRRSITDFQVRLPVGKRIPVLVLPNEPDTVIPGTRNSGPFEIFSNLIGGDVIAVLVIGLLGFMGWVGPRGLVQWIRARKEIVDGPSAAGRRHTRRK